MKLITTKPGIQVSTVILLLFGTLSCGLFFVACQSPSPTNEVSDDPYEINHVAQSQNAMVVSAHPLASKIGTEIMQQGGNAVDAAVAVQFALAVVYPRAGNIGGGGFMTIRDQSGAHYSLDYREMAPAAAFRDMYLDGSGQIISGKSTDGHLAVGVPGTVDGLYKAWDSLGQIASFAQLIQPAIHLAAKGFLINHSEANRLNHFQSSFQTYHSVESPFLNPQWKAGDRLVQKALAHTLERIAKAGHPSGFYKGTTADYIVEEMQRGGGLINKGDLANYTSKWRTPLLGTYHDLTIISMPPSSSGGIALIQLLRILEAYQLDTMKWHSPEYMHLITEAERRVYADRATYLGDMDFVNVPINKLLDPTYLAGRMENFQSNRATPSSSVGIDSIQVPLESFETTHTSVVDNQGMAVSVTTTLNTNYGSKVLVAGAGFFLNNEMDDFSAKPGSPNTYGLIGNEANAIAPGKRMLSSMTPTIVEKNGELILVLGTPGGSTIITSVLQVILNATQFDMPLDEAVFAPRFHHQWLPDEIYMEKNGFDQAVLDALTNMGHSYRMYDRIGLVKAIKRLPDGSLIGVGDRRSDDHAEGY